MSLPGRISGAVLTVGSAVSLVTFFPSPDGAHWLGAAIILTCGVALAFADRVDTPASGKTRLIPTRRQANTKPAH